MTGRKWKHRIEDEQDCNDIDVVVGCNHLWGLPNAELNNKKETKCSAFTGNLFLILVFYPILLSKIVPQVPQKTL